MAKALKVNPYNVFNVRRVDYPPTTFEYANVFLGYNMKDAVERWIESNLKSRYYLGKTVTLDNTNSMVHSIKIGFEESRELSYFMLACPHLKYK